MTHAEKCDHCGTPAHSWYYKALCTKRYDCPSCGKSRPWCDGAADVLPEVCDQCWSQLTDSGRNVRECSDCKGKGCETCKHIGEVVAVPS